MQQLEVPGAVIEYVTEGSGPPVLLTHGALVADAVIVPLAGQPALTSSYQLIGYRRRGYAANGNAGITDGTTLADYAADAAALLRHLGVDKAHVVGHSSGALISLQLAHDHPDLVASLALLEPPLADPDAHRRHREQVLFPAMKCYMAGQLHAESGAVAYRRLASRQAPHPEDSHSTRTGPARQASR